MGLFTFYVELTAFILFFAIVLFLGLRKKDHRAVMQILAGSLFGVKLDTDSGIYELASDLFGFVLISRHFLVGTPYFGSWSQYLLISSFLDDFRDGTIKRTDL